ncbi:MAG: hypothetical protein ACHRXM_00695 [Isosphaerales bacterium]
MKITSAGLPAEPLRLAAGLVLPMIEVLDALARAITDAGFFTNGVEVIREVREPLGHFPTIGDLIP